MTVSCGMKLDKWNSIEFIFFREDEYDKSIAIRVAFKDITPEFVNQLDNIVTTLRQSGFAK